MNINQRQEHIKLYTKNKIVTKQEIQDRARMLNMTDSEYLYFCVQLEIDNTSN